MAINSVIINDNDNKKVVVRRDEGRVKIRGLRWWFYTNKW